MTKFERDKVYKTRDGRDVRILSLSGHDDYPVIGIIAGNKGPSAWTADGRVPSIPSCKNAHEARADLMLPKPEPVVEWGLLEEQHKPHEQPEFFRFRTEADARHWLKNPPNNSKKCRLAKRTTEIVE